MLCCVAAGPSVVVASRLADFFEFLRCSVVGGSNRLVCSGSRSFETDSGVPHSCRPETSPRTGGGACSNERVVRSSLPVGRELSRPQKTRTQLSCPPVLYTHTYIYIYITYIYIPPPCSSLRVGACLPLLDTSGFFSFLFFFFFILFFLFPFAGTLSFGHKHDRHTLSLHRLFLRVLYCTPPHCHCCFASGHLRCLFFLDTGALEERLAAIGGGAVAWVQRGDGRGVHACFQVNSTHHLCNPEP